MLADLIAETLAQHPAYIRSAKQDGLHLWNCRCSYDAYGQGDDPSAIQATMRQHVAEAIQAAIESSQPHHLIDLRDDGLTIQHSMACRLSGELFDCEVNQAALRLAGPPLDPGRYTCAVVDGLLVIGEAVTADD